MNTRIQSQISSKLSHRRQDAFREVSRFCALSAILQPPTKPSGLPRGSKWRYRLVTFRRSGPPPLRRQLAATFSQRRSDWSWKPRASRDTFGNAGSCWKSSLSGPQAAQMLGRPRQTPHDRVRAGTLLAVRERGGLRFPRWQFDPDGPDGILAGLPQVLKALDISPLAKVSWLVRANPFLQGRSPVQALKSGELEAVLVRARGVGVT